VEQDRLIYKVGDLGVVFWEFWYWVAWQNLKIHLSTIYTMQTKYFDFKYNNDFYGVN